MYKDFKGAFLKFNVFVVTFTRTIALTVHRDSLTISKAIIVVFLPINSTYWFIFSGALTV